MPGVGAARAQAPTPEQLRTPRNGSHYGWPPRMTRSNQEPALVSADLRKRRILDRPPGSAAEGVTGRFACGLGDAPSIALACEADDVGVVHDAVDERGHRGGVREDRRPVAEGQVGGEGEAPPLIPA